MISRYTAPLRRHEQREGRGERGLCDFVPSVVAAPQHECALQWALLVCGGDCGVQSTKQKRSMERTRHNSNATQLGRVAVRTPKKAEKKGGTWESFFALHGGCE